ncbi:MAG: AAA family ATPase [Muribaculaceae bacterium]|nr:AAA family ATPase [Muribaculaceae bacterium]
MILNLHSLAFNTFTTSGGGNPAWGTEMGQGDGYRFSFEDSDKFITALVYNSIPNPQSRIYCPLGKGGQQADDYEFVIGSLFNKVFVNNILVDGKFLLLVVKKLVGANHVGRRTLKYNPRMTLDGINYNEPCFKTMARAIGASDGGSWFVSQIEVKNQDELHFTAHILDAEQQTTFENAEDRSRKLQEKLQAYAKDTEDSNLRKFAENLRPDESRQVIYFGAPGTGKSFAIKDACDRFEHYRITFHPDTDYSSFVGSYKPTTKEVILRDMSGHPIKENNEIVTEDKIIYEFVTQSFLKAYIAAWKEQANATPSPVFLIIEEINRGNCAQIFGDIFQLLDRNEKGFSEYSISSDSDLQKKLAKSFKDLVISRTSEINSLYGKDIVSKILDGTELLLPDNLFIRATMNTSDQSLFPIDSAFKRRWDWRYVNIKNHEEENYAISFSNGNKYSWWDFLEKINAQIEGGDIQQEDKKLGYFFAKAQKGEISAETFLSKVIFFLYNDVFKDFGLDQDFFKDEKGQTMTFASYFDHKGKIIEDKVEKFLNNLDIQPLPSDDDNSDFDGETPIKSGIHARVNGIKVWTITYALYNTLRAVVKNYNYNDLLNILNEHIIRESEFIKTIPSAEGYQKEKRWYNYKPLTTADGITFVITNQWKKEYIPQIKQLAKALNVSFEDIEE